MSPFHYLARIMVDLLSEIVINHRRICFTIKLRVNAVLNN
ncbi:hypothetical protein DFQ01_10160 [Paenibacillus cellulosilyticus]|uniref:Uncharacterized protein n=1 Tax=Paenibacillus cellulosilyticus TaxID=375489 RepID=A0A2V2YZ16_9BACL|nr:hypothetical protein DFQ01_10160 [Paenibacillus cellulosilyticus]